MARDKFINKPQFFFLLAFIGLSLFLVNIVLLTGVDVQGKIALLKIPIQKITGAEPPPQPEHPKLPSWDDDHNFDAVHEDADNHPIVKLTKLQLDKFEEYKRSQSKTFKEVVAKYRQLHGRHPPPDFDKWYKFAKKKGSLIFDDFQQIYDDLRPYWGVEPKDIRLMVRRMVYDVDSKTAVIHVRKRAVTQTTRAMSWHAEVFEKMMRVIAHVLPDMDIAINLLDEPRVVVPWEDIQEKLKYEQDHRIMGEGSLNEFSTIDWDAMNETNIDVDLGFFKYSEKPYMDLATKACPPTSLARITGSTIREAEATYKEPLGGLVMDFNRSSDLCTIGPHIAHTHGLLFASSTLVATQKLVPIFGQSKVNVNNDILFPANNYYDVDVRYNYDPTGDIDWNAKKNVLVWRGDPSGGVQNETTWRNLHRHRFVALTNATLLGQLEKHLLASTDEEGQTGEYEDRVFRPASFMKGHSNVGFTQLCEPDSVDADVPNGPDCGWLKSLVAVVPEMKYKDLFANKFLVDIDSNSISGQWYALLKSKAMVMKATIFKEWHDSRLFEWAHFVPMDNSFDDIYSLLTYYIGLGTTDEGANGAYVPRHDFEAKYVADRGQEWANNVLRKEDIEVYMYRLMLEYARVIDDNRDKIGYSGDGSEVS